METIISIDNNKLYEYDISVTCLGMKIPPKKLFKMYNLNKKKCDMKLSISLKLDTCKMYDIGILGIEKEKIYLNINTLHTPKDRGLVEMMGFIKIINLIPISIKKHSRISHVWIYPYTNGEIRNIKLNKMLEKKKEKP